MKYNIPKSLVFVKLFILIVASWGCVENLEDQEIYKRPAWLDGKIFDQMKQEENLSTYISCLEKTGYDSLLNASGSYTIMAPTNEAFEKFFESHPGYSSVDDIPQDELKAMVEYQIIYNAWTRDQFQSLDVSGWIDPESQSYNEPRGYKRQTLFQEDNKSYSVVRSNNVFKIVEPSESSNQKIAYTASSKYVPIFFSEYLNIFDLNSNDYQFYFDRSFDPNKIYFAGSAIDDQIPAENGFIYKSDRVIQPLLSAEEILKAVHESHSYHTFLYLIQEFSELTSNFEATFNQPDARKGLDVDTLYDVRYPGLVFNIHNEFTGTPNMTIRQHYGLLAPTDEAFEEFTNTYLATGWGALEELPKVVKEIIVNTHMSERAIYKKDLNTGFFNGVDDRLFISEDKIVQKTYGSNSSFIGLNEVIVPRAFKSVARPVFLERGYDIMLYALERTKVLSALKNEDADYSFFLPADADIGVSGDSSLFINYLDPEETRFDFRSYNRSLNKVERLPIITLRKMLLNQVGVTTPKGIAKKEFIENLGGNYITVNNETGTAEGTASSSFGRNGDEPVSIEPVLYQKETDNGQVYKVQTFFSYSGRTYWTLFTSQFKKFQGLMQKAGLYDPVHNDYPFLTKNEYYTVFAPSDSAIANSGLDTLPKEELKKALEYHFVKGDLIFTDGNAAEGRYKTIRVDESSSDINVNNSTLHIRPKPDVIEILDINGQVYHAIPEDDNTTNIFITIDTDESSGGDYENITTGVVHVIDKVLTKDLLQAN